MSDTTVQTSTAFHATLIAFLVIYLTKGDEAGFLVSKLIHEAVESLQFKISLICSDRFGYQTVDFKTKMLLTNQQFLVLALCLALHVISNDAGPLSGVEILQLNFCRKIHSS